MASASSPPSSLHVFQLLLLLATAAIVVVADAAGSFGSLQSIQGAGEDAQVQSLARFAISENARQLRRRRDVVRTEAAAAAAVRSDSLTFVGVTRAYKHSDEVAGTVYYLVLTAKDGSGEEKSYDAAVLVEPSRKSKAVTLLSFGPSRTRSRI